MSDRTNLPTVSDGLDDYDDESGRSLIKGTKLKFSNDFEWTDSNDTAIAASREFLVVEIVKALQKWIGSVPVETQILAAHEKFPDIGELNKQAPREEWTEKFGRDVGPWQKAYVVYLLDPETMQVFTFPTSTAGGMRAVSELRDSTRLARRIRGPHVYPRVRLADTHMKTQFGGRQRPFFDIVGFEALGDPGTAALAAAERPKQIEAPKQQAEPKVEAKSKPAAKASTESSAPKQRKADPDFDDAA